MRLSEHFYRQADIEELFLITVRDTPWRFRAFFVRAAIDEGLLLKGRIDQHNIYRASKRRVYVVDFF